MAKYLAVCPDLNQRVTENNNGDIHTKFLLRAKIELFIAFEPGSLDVCCLWRWIMLAALHI